VAILFVGLLAEHTQDDVPTPRNSPERASSGPAPDMIDPGIDRFDEMDDGGRHPVAARVHQPGRQSLDQAENHQCKTGGEKRCREYANLRVVQIGPLEGDRRDQQRHGEADPAEGCGADQRGPWIRERHSSPPRS
jgi:hypothetical protein